MVKLKILVIKAKQKYRGMFETQKSGNKASSGEIDLHIITLASPKVGQDQVSGGVSVLFWHAAHFPFRRNEMFNFDLVTRTCDFTIHKIYNRSYKCIQQQNTKFIDR